MSRKRTDARQTRDIDNQSPAMNPIFDILPHNSNSSRRDSRRAEEKRLDFLVRFFFGCGLGVS